MPRQSYNYDYIPGDPRYCFMVQFLDPSTLKINLDTEDNRFAGISNINVEWFYGVYPFRTPGHTNPHRSFMGLPLVGNLEAKKEKWWTDVALPFKNDGDNISRFDNWMLIPDLAAALRTPGEAEAGETWRWHVGSSFPYSELDLDLFPPGFPVKDHYTLYNGVLKRAAENLDSFIVDPLVSLPTVSDYSDSFGDYVVPDFVVWVMVSFEYTDGEGKTRTAAFSKRFLPDVKTVSLEEFKSKHWGELVRYRSSSTAGDAFQTIEGKDGNVGVHHKGGADQVYRILKLADYIYDNKL